MTTTTHDTFAAPDSLRVPSKAGLWTARGLTALSTLFLGFDAGVKLFATEFASKFSVELGYPPGVTFTLGLIEAACLALYLVPRTRILGAILWTGYLGGAIATHVRVGSPLASHTLFPIYVAAALWGAVYLTDSRVRALLPFARKEA